MKLNSNFLVNLRDRNLYIKSLYIFLIIIFFYQMYSIHSEYTFALDSFTKLWHTFSIFNNDFKSEEIIYLASDLDPLKEFYPSGFTFLNKGIYIAPFSFTFAFLNATLLYLISWKFLPYVCLVTAFLSFIILRKIKRLSLVTLILAGFGTPLLFQGMEFSENALLLLIESIGLLFYYKKETSYSKFFMGFFLMLGIWLRLEMLVFLALLFVSIYVFTYRFDLFRFFREEKFSILGILFPFSIFCIYNFFSYGHPFGSRYISTQGAIANLMLPERLLNMRNLIFLAKWKIGFFGFTPIFLLPLAFFCFPNQRNLLTDKDKVFHSTIICFLPLISFFAPNDGVTNWGPRYLNLAIIPCLLLFDQFYAIQRKENPRRILIIFIVLFLYSISILFLGFKFQKVATKEIGAIQYDLSQRKADLHILGSGVIFLYSGGALLDTKTIQPKNGEHLANFLSRNINSIPKGKNLILSKLKLDPRMEEAVKIGLLPPNTHHEELLKVLKANFQLISEYDGKRLNLYQFAK